MINFPVFDHLDISEYRLYPGAEDSEPGLHIDFRPGLTLVLGANGLGKTTLIRIIFRMLTGPFDIPRLEGRPDLGTARLDATGLSRRRRKTFANRVMDSARDANARLSFHIGLYNVTVERRLSNLDLTRLEIDDQEIEIKGEKIYQNTIIKLAGLSSFGDWILLLRFLTFYFEDRRALVWDPAAQRQILRLLLLPASTAKRWTRDEREILELDSRRRNLNATVGREERALSESEAKVEMREDVHNELERLTSLQETETELFERLAGELLEVDSARRQARLRVLKSEQERETQFRGIERTKLAAIGAQFPNSSYTGLYILAQLLTGQSCIVCGEHVPKVAANYAARIERAQCVVCGSPISNSGIPLTSEGGMVNSEMKQAIVDLERIEADLAEARRALKEAEVDYQSHVAQINKLRRRIDDRSHQIDLLVQQLPPEEAQMHEQRSQLALLRARVDELKIQIDEKRERFGEFVQAKDAGQRSNMVGCKYVSLWGSAYTS